MHLLKPSGGSHPLGVKPGSPYKPKAHSPSGSARCYLPAASPTYLSTQHSGTAFPHWVQAGPSDSLPCLLPDNAWLAPSFPLDICPKATVRTLLSIYCQPSSATSCSRWYLTQLLVLFYFSQGTSHRTYTYIFYLLTGPRG